VVIGVGTQSRWQHQLPNVLQAAIVKQRNLAATLEVVLERLQFEIKCSSSIRFWRRAWRLSARFRASLEFSRALTFPACSWCFRSSAR
jgi:hypothetical protein